LGVVPWLAAKACNGREETLSPISTKIANCRTVILRAARERDHGAPETAKLDRAALVDERSSILSAIEEIEDLCAEL
jgi:hypothetical protein